MGNHYWGKDSLLNNKTFNDNNYWNKNRFLTKKKYINPYSTLRAREKNKKFQNTSNFYNVSENEFVSKF